MLQLINDRLWAELEPLIPVDHREGRRGPKGHGDRVVLEGIAYVMSRGIAWNSLPLGISGVSGLTCYKRHKAWAAVGAWDAIEETLVAGLARGGVRSRKSLATSGD
jgi:transposase